MTWHLHPDVILWIVAIEAAYLLGLRTVGRAAGKRATRGQIAWFSAGVFVLYIGAGTPIHDIAEERLFFVHMNQHMLFTLVAPPLLLLGTPGWLVEGLIDGRRRLKIARFFTSAPIAFTLFNVLTAVVHLPLMVNTSLEHHSFHYLVHVLLISSATLMWWPVLSPTPLLPRLAVPVQMVYLLLQSLVPTVLASFITFASTPLYEFYVGVPRMWGMSVVEDQRNAGLLMKIGGGVILWIAIGMTFFKWVAREESRSRRPELVWEDVEEELGRMGLSGPRAAP